MICKIHFQQLINRAGKKNFGSVQTFPGQAIGQLFSLICCIFLIFLAEFFEIFNSIFFLSKLW